MTENETMTFAEFVEWNRERRIADMERAAREEYPNDAPRTDAKPAGRRKGSRR